MLLKISIFVYGWFYYHTCKKILLPWQMLVPMILWQMLLSIFHVLYIFMADVIATGLCIYPFIYIW